MRLKIEITRRFFRDAGKDRAGHQAAVIQFRFARVRIVQHNEPDKFRMIGRQISDERNDILAVFVAAFGIDFLRRAGFARDRETGNSRGRGGAAIAHDTAQRIPDLRRRLGRNDLPQNDRRKCADRFAICCR